jgi:hypothetical protein
MRLATAVETQQRLRYLGRGRVEASVEKREGGKEGIDEGHEEKREGAVLDCST